MSANIVCQIGLFGVMAVAIAGCSSAQSGPITGCELDADGGATLNHRDGTTSYQNRAELTGDGKRCVVDPSTGWTVTVIG